MKVDYCYSEQIIEGVLIYRAYEYSFDFLSNHRSGDVYILIRYLQLTFDSSDNRLLTVWGVNPTNVWKKKKLLIPVFNKGIVKVRDDYEYQSSIAYRFEEFDRWETYFDEKSGWVCVGNYNLKGDAIMFAQNIGVVLLNNEIVSLWLKPKFIHTKR